jgi:hypothetical protein
VTPGQKADRCSKQQVVVVGGVICTLGNAASRVQPLRGQRTAWNILSMEQSCYGADSCLALVSILLYLRAFGPQELEGGF